MNFDNYFYTNMYSIEFIMYILVVSCTTAFPTFTIPLILYYFDNKVTAIILEISFILHKLYYTRQVEKFIFQNEFGQYQLYNTNYICEKDKDDFIVVGVKNNEIYYPLSKYDKNFLKQCKINYLNI